MQSLQNPKIIILSFFFQIIRTEESELQAVRYFKRVL